MTAGATDSMNLHRSNPSTDRINTTAGVVRKNKTRGRSGSFGRLADVMLPRERGDSFDDASSVGNALWKVEGDNANGYNGGGGPSAGKILPPEGGSGSGLMNRINSSFSLLSLGNDLAAEQVRGGAKRDPFWNGRGDAAASVSSAVPAARQTEAEMTNLLVNDPALWKEFQKKLDESGLKTGVGVKEVLREFMRENMEDRVAFNDAARQESSSPPSDTGMKRVLSSPAMSQVQQSPSPGGGMMGLVRPSLGPNAHSMRQPSASSNNHRRLSFKSLGAMLSLDAASDVDSQAGGRDQQPDGTAPPSPPRGGPTLQKNRRRSSVTSSKGNCASSVSSGMASIDEEAQRGPATGRRGSYGRCSFGGGGGRSSFGPLSNTVIRAASIVSALAAEGELDDDDDFDFSDDEQEMDDFCKGEKMSSSSFGRRGPEQQDQQHEASNSNSSLLSGPSGGADRQRMVEEEKQELHNCSYMGWGASDDRIDEEGSDVSDDERD